MEFEVQVRSRKTSNLLVCDYCSTKVSAEAHVSNDLINNYNPVNYEYSGINLENGDHYYLHETQDRDYRFEKVVRKSKQLP